MPGVPKSERCISCRRRKVKCDLQWPTCTPCKRLNVSCSGPQKRHRFILNGSHLPYDEDVPSPPISTAGDPSNTVTLSSSHAHVSPRAMAVEDTTPWYCINTIRCQDAGVGGAYYGFFRLPTAPSRQPVNSTDRLTAYFCSQLADKRYADSATGLGFLKHVPSRLGESAALRDAVALFCSTWLNYWRGLPSDQLIDSRLQSRAARSLRDALTGSRQLASETLAAVTIMQRIEVFFQNGNGEHCILHLKGMLGLMGLRGPPNLDDKLDVRITLDNQTALLGLWTVQDGGKMLFSPTWRQSMAKISRALVYHEEDDPEVGSTLALELMYWNTTSLVGELRDLQRCQRNGTLQDHGQRIFELYRQVQETLNKALELGEPVMANLRSLGKVKEVPEPNSPIGSTYDFAKVRTCELVASYVLYLIVLQRMLRDSSRLMSIDDEPHVAEHRRLCRECLMFCPYLMRRGPIACAQFATALFISIEGLEGQERAFLVKFVLDSTGFTPSVDEDVEAAFLKYVAEGVSGVARRLKIPITLPSPSRLPVPTAKDQHQVRMGT